MNSNLVKSVNFRQVFTCIDCHYCVGVYHGSGLCQTNNYCEKNEMNLCNSNNYVCDLFVKRGIEEQIRYDWMKNR